jgi:hypothetical protein
MALFAVPLRRTFTTAAPGSFERDRPEHQIATVPSFRSVPVMPLLLPTAMLP